MQVFLNGIFFGFLLTILIGPVFFSLIQTSIERGFKSGASMAVGISLSDSLYIFIVYLGVSPFLENDTFKIGLGVAGGFIMFCFGLYSIMKPVPHHTRHRRVKGKNNVIKQVAKGFMLNGINPFVLIFWLGMVSMGTVKFNYSREDMLVFSAGIILTVFTTDIIKSYIANKLRNLITIRFMQIMNRLVGIVLFIFGFRLFYFAIESF
ncbi:MAG: LysE family translocator [Bacteroidota bacterium]|jgi:threonine/homoserine/homoserine lactone efflux protein|nr:LysE family translocator [Bacteroidota bacterium]